MVVNDILVPRAAIFHWSKGSQMRRRQQNDSRACALTYTLTSGRRRPSRRSFSSPEPTILLGSRALASSEICAVAVKVHFCNHGQPLLFQTSEIFRRTSVIPCSCSHVPVRKLKITLTQIHAKQDRSRITFNSSLHGSRLIQKPLSRARSNGLDMGNHE